MPMPHGPGAGSTALVLGGGGVTGRAWELGLLAGLLDAGIDLTSADTVIGTSAGSAVGALLLAGPGSGSGPDSAADPRALYERELAGPVPGELAGRFTGALFLQWLRIGLRLRSGPPEELGRAFGRLAVAARTVSEQQRLDELAARVPVHQEWPLRRLLITAVDVLSGERVVFSASSGVRLLDAVAASCSVPGVWPPVTIDGRRYIDGGMRSPANVDLAAGYERVVVLAPSVGGFQRGSSPAAQVAALGAGVRATVVVPDKAARSAIGRKILDPARRAPAARAGYAQAASVASRVAAVWGQ